MSSATLDRPTVAVIQTEVPLEGTVTVTLAQVDDQKFPNYRTKARESHLVDLFGKIKQHDQLTPCVGAWVDGKVAIIDGFCRLEVIRRIALEKLVNEYNKTNNFETTDPNYVSLGGDGFDSHKNRERIRQAGGDWTAKYDAALAGKQIVFRTVAVENAADAALKSIVANTYDKPPLMDLCERIEKVLTENDGNVSQKDVAKALKMSEPAISQHRKITATPAYLRTLFAGDLSELVKKGEEQEPVRATLLTAVAEFERRLAMEQEVPVPGGGTKPNEQVVSFSHARDFSGAVMHKTEPMTLAGVRKALFDLVGMQENGKLSDSYATPDYGVYKAKLNEAKRIGKAEEKPAETATAATPAPATNATSTPTTTVSPEVAAQFAAAGQKLEGQAAAPVSTGNQPAAAAPPAQPATPQVPNAANVPVASQQPTLSPQDQARMAEIQAANNPSDRIDDLLATEEAPVSATAPTDGQMKSVTKEAPVPDKYKNKKPPEKVELMANKMLDYATDERSTPAAQIGYLLASAQLFNAVGMDDAELVVNEQFVTLDDAFGKYVAALEAQVKEAKGETVLNEIKATLPKFVRPNLAK